MAGTSGDDDVEMKTEKRRNPSVISLAIARTASKPAGISSMDTKELIQGLYSGVILGDNKLKLWVDDKLGKNSFMLLASELSIRWGDDFQFSRWPVDKEDCFGGPVDIKVAHLYSQELLDISGKFPSIMLSLMTPYEVVFVFKMSQDTIECDCPINLGLSLPNRTTQNGTEDFGKKPKGQWLEVPLGDFVFTTEDVGYIEFFLKGHGAIITKKGLFVKGVIFRPRY